MGAVDLRLPDNGAPIGFRHRATARWYRWKIRARAFIRRHLPAIIITNLIFWFLVVLLAPRIFITIHAGEGGVMFRRFGGTVLNRNYGEGLYVIPPWDTLTPYNLRYQVMNLEVEALSKQGVPLKVDLTVRYRPALRMLGPLHQAVGPNYKDIIVIPNIQSTLREVFVNYDVEDAYKAQAPMMAKLDHKYLREAQDHYVLIDDVMITRVTMPPEIHAAISAKMNQQQLTEAYAYRIQGERAEAERKLIEANGIRAANETIGKSLNKDVLTWENIKAIEGLAHSTNAKIVVTGGDKAPALIVNPN